MSKLASLVLIAVALVGCDKGSETATPVAPTVTNAAPNKPAQTIAPEPTPPATLAEADVEKVVDAWVAAQNDSDFAAYEAVYAPKFEGIKRVGARKSSYDRDGWLKDRKRMFEKKVEVSADDLEISTAGRSAVARFTQTWASGTFKDVSPKQLVIVSEGDKLLIAREEMLTSTVMGAAKGDAEAHDPRRLALVVDSKWAVLNTDTAGLVTSKPSILTRDGSAIADVTTAPPEMSKLIGAEFVVYGGAAACSAKVKSLHVLARAVPHFGQVGYWNGEEDGYPKMSDKAVARETWDLASGQGHVLVGALDKECPGGTWAHATNTKPEILGSIEAKSLKAQAEKRFRSLAGYRAIQKDYESMEKKTSPWEADGRIDVLGFGEGKAQYLAVVAAAGDGCGDFHGEFWALFEVAPSGDLVLLTDPKDPGTFFEPEGAVREGGQVLFFSDDVIIEKVGPTWQRTLDATVPYFDCPC